VPVGPGRGARRGDRLHELARGQHDLEPEHAVLDLSVLRRELPGAARGEPAAERRAMDRRREMPEREPFAGERVLEVLAVDAGLGFDDEALRIDAANFFDRLEIEHDAAAKRSRAAADARARAERDDGKAALVREPEDRLHFGGVPRANDGA